MNEDFQSNEQSILHCTARATCDSVSHSSDLEANSIESFTLHLSMRMQMCKDTTAEEPKNN